MAMQGAEIVKRYERLKADRANFDARWELMAPYISPSRVGIQSQVYPGTKQTNKVFDSTAMMASELMAMFVSGSIMNPGQQWGSMSMRQAEVRENDAVREWLEECRERELRAFADSMFYSEGSETLIDWAGFGTGFLLMEEQPQSLHRQVNGFRGFFCEAQKTGRFVIADGPDGLVDTAMREFKLTARVIQSRWPDAVLPEKLSMALQTGKPDTLFTIIHAILPRSMQDQRGGAGAKAMPWSSVWVEMESKSTLYESGYRTFPGAVVRYLRTPGEVFGRGRGDIAYGDVWTLNEAKRMALEDWALKIRPPILVRHDSVFGTLRLVPGGATVIDTHGGRMEDSLRAFETGSHPEVSQIKEEQLRQSIRQIFFVDQILALMQVSKSEMTAFEYSKKLELLFTMMGPVYGRTEREFLRPLWDTAFDIMFHAGAFSPPPQEVFDTDGTIDVIFENPLARSRRVTDVEAISLAFNDLAPLAQKFPQILDRFDPDGASKHVFTVRGVPAVAERSEDEMKAVRDAHDQQIQQELVMNQVQGASEAMKNAAPMIRALQPQGTQGA